MNYRREYTLYKRGKYWYYRIYDEKSNRIAKSTGQTSKGAARVFCDMLLKADKLNFRSQTFCEYATGFFDEGSVYVKATSIKKTTAQGYKSNLDKRIMPYLKNYEMKNISYSTLLSFRSELAEKYAVNSINSIMGTLKIIFKTAQKDGVIARDPFNGMHNLSAGMRADAFTREELKTFLESIQDPAARRFALLIALTGLRLSEAIGLNENDFKLIDGIDCIHLTRQYYQGKYTTLKTGGERIVPILQVMNKITYGYKKTVLYKALKGAFEKVNADRKIKLTVHSLRHFFVTSAKSFGIQESKVEMIAGHSLKGIQGVYTNFKAPDLAEINKWQKDVLEYVGERLIDAREGTF